MWPNGLRKGRENIRISACTWIFACIVALQVSSLFSQESRVFDNEKIVRFDERLKFYLDQKTKDHLFEMAAKERLQLETIKNLALEIKQRGAIGADAGSGKAARIARAVRRFERSARGRDRQSDALQKVHAYDDV